MQFAGLRTFHARDHKKSGLSSYERATAKLDAAYENRLQANPKVWAFFHAQPLGYQSTARFWVMSATRAETRLKRLEQLIEDSAQGRTIPPLTRRSKSR